MGLKNLFIPVGSMDPDQAKKFLDTREEGTYTLLDVRQPGEYEQAHIPGAHLVPLPRLVDSMHELPSDKPTLVYCAVGGRSRVAAQMLSAAGFEEVYNLKGGIKAWEGLPATGTEDWGMDLLEGGETPHDVLRTAFGLERTLSDFYSKLAEEATDSDVRDLFLKLAGIERRHMDTVREMYAQTDASGEPVDSARDPGVLEGGFQPDRFRSQLESILHSVPDIISAAMTLEAQALDLYLRLAREVTDEASRTALTTIADQEKAHLARLGDLMDEKI